MALGKRKILLLSIFCLLKYVTSFDIITGSYVLGGAFASSFLSSYLRCFFKECCDNSWIGLNSTELYLALDKKLFGQHLVKDVVVKHIEDHFKTDSPSKALALSFHGETGTGKNFVVKIIAEHLYRRGMKSEFVHIIPATTEFQHERMVQDYKKKLRRYIKERLELCERSLFIFDEMDKLPTRLIDTIKQRIHACGSRKAIFIFLSNTAGKAISRYTLDHWQNGMKRKDIKLSDMEKIVTTCSLEHSEKGTLWHAELTENLKIPTVPFLPLEKRHVKQCIIAYLMEKKLYKHPNHIGEDKIQEVLKELSFYPTTEQMFSVTGCKRVRDKVDYIFEEMDI